MLHELCCMQVSCSAGTFPRISHGVGEAPPQHSLTPAGSCVQQGFAHPAEHKLSKP